MMKHRTPLPAADYVDITADRLRAVHDAVVTPALPQPDYAAPRPDGSRVGRLTAEAMKVEYDSAAKAIEAMGEHLLELQRRMDEEAHNILDAIDEINRIAKYYREEGQQMFSRIEQCAKQTQRIREICTDLAPKA